MLRISISTLNKMKATNKILYKRLGKRILFNRIEVMNALEDSNSKKLRNLNLS